MNKIRDEKFVARQGRGRPKGSPNKLGKAAKEVIAEAADRLGGVDRIVDWAREAPDNEKAFWTTIYPKLIPLNVDANVNAGLSPELAAWLGRPS